jgi:hypothetical protein
LRLELARAGAAADSDSDTGANADVNSNANANANSNANGMALKAAEAFAQAERLAPGYYRSALASALALAYPVPAATPPPDQGPRPRSQPKIHGALPQAQQQIAWDPTAAPGEEQPGEMPDFEATQGRGGTPRFGAGWQPPRTTPPARETRDW